MNLFDEFTDRSELLRAIESEIIEAPNADGVTAYRIANREADALKAKCEAANRAAAREEKKRRELELKLDETLRKNAENDLTLERLRAESGKSRDTDDALRRYVDLTNAARARAAQLEAEIIPLREENARYKERETRREIERQLVEAAKKMDCCESALRDVRRLAPQFALNDDGLAVTEDSKLVAEVLAEEIALSPHWLNRSQGGMANPGALADPIAARDFFRATLDDENANFDDVLNAAPKSRVRPF